MYLLKLFLSFLKIGAFSFGGGYAVLALIQKEIITINRWITPSDFVNIVAIAEMTPGPIAVNSSTYVGYKVGGFTGSALATLGVVLVPVIVTLFTSISFNKFRSLKQVNWILKGIRPAVLGLIAAACIDIGKISFTDLKSVIIGLLTFFSVYKLKLHPILAIVTAGFMGIVLYGFI